MADGTLATQDGARICNALGIMRACLETAKLDDLEGRLAHLGVSRHEDALAELDRQNIGDLDDDDLESGKDSPVH
jgi:hypothetical protein